MDAMAALPSAAPPARRHLTRPSAETGSTCRHTVYQAGAIKLEEGALPAGPSRLAWAKAAYTWPATPPTRRHRCARYKHATVTVRVSGVDAARHRRHRRRRRPSDARPADARDSPLPARASLNRAAPHVRRTPPSTYLHADARR
ncbi:MAG: hypothetical protein ACLU0O_02045 [Collinsella sp.]